MRLTYVAFLFALFAYGMVDASVTPVVDETPLALREIPMNGTVLQSKNLRGIDDWINVRVNSDNTGQVQNEQQVVVNPINPDNVVAVWRDFRLGYRRVGIGRSFDGGFTWDDELFYEPVFPRQSDPGLAWHSSGAIYSVVLSFDWGSADGLFVSSSTNGGLTWGPWVPAVINYTSQIFEDKELIACDHTGSQYDGNLYIAWTRFEYVPSSQTTITVVRSTDGGFSWDTPVAVGDEHGVQWPVPAVGAEGEVYVAWVKYYDDEIRLDKSTDAGVTWGSDIMVQQTSFASGYINPQLLIFAFPAMDVDITTGPNRGNIYIAYSDDWYGDADIFFTLSSNNGDNWTTPTRVNDDAIGNSADQFHPWLVCDEQGTLHLIFYDRRNDLPQNLFMDLYYTYSTDAGITWSPNERITEVSSNPSLDSLDSGLIGEYNGLAVREGVIHPVWTDTRNGHQDTYSAAWQNPFPTRHPLAGTIIGGLIDTRPNPFNGEVHISLKLQDGGHLNLTVFDLQGRKVSTLAEGEFPAGEVSRSWRPDGAAGIYIVRAVTDAGIDAQKILYLK
ncbi:hypothetical protein CEE37_08395 [candidate division LCP-89 bacterium B3_LCP]|uniref:Secretion system C-terminal sorting domain-containing protein n=1 Tax=candidate division LCP-89 bacterium B3_LCP TaxID=2012998 RepID=A0A532UZG3_UNCL8|nr:MAG: hypothetical protein CEE37_08395 [candidate division LCP-89 bacterium B3_LCP]